MRAFAFRPRTQPAFGRAPGGGHEKHREHLHNGTDGAREAPSLPRCLSSLAGAAFADLPPQPSVVPANPDEPVDTIRGWQRPASCVVDDSTAGRFRAMLDLPSVALLESQCGPFTC